MVFRNMRKKLKEQLDEYTMKEINVKKATEMEHQRKLMEEQTRINGQREKEQEEARRKQREIEENWIRKKLQMEQEATNMQQLEAKQ